ncbi:MAG TPA: hypothetical protein VFI06_14825 [Chitinophagaceae bacterium]|nr:hypothetical protein [Chitinophagaceae bacterium]
MKKAYPPFLITSMMTTAIIIAPAAKMISATTGFNYLTLIFFLRISIQELRAKSQDPTNKERQNQKLKTYHEERFFIFRI